MLMLIYTFNSTDRLALGLFMQEIKTEFSVSDAQLGLLSGLAFALFYSLMGIPIARAADRGNRINIIAITTTLWSILVALCGAAQSFAQLVLLRIGVGVGEAGCVPPAHSLIAHYYDRGDRPRAMAVYALGGALSVVVGYFVAGWLDHVFGWRESFVLLAVPGLILGPLAWLTLVEPRQSDAAAESPRATAAIAGLSASKISVGLPLSLRNVYALLWSNRTFRQLMFLFCIQSFFSVGILQWRPSFFVRSFHEDVGSLGTWLAVTNGVGGLVGIYLGGVWSSKWAREKEHLQLRMVALSSCLFALSSAATYLASDRKIAMLLLGVSTIGGTIVTGPLFASVQALVPERLRATAVAVMFTMANFIGMGLGPVAVGALSDWLRPHFGADSLRYALLAVSPGYLWVGYHAWRASSTIGRDVGLLNNDRTCLAAPKDGRVADVARTSLDSVT